MIRRMFRCQCCMQNASADLDSSSQYNEGPPETINIREKTNIKHHNNTEDILEDSILPRTGEEQQICALAREKDEEVPTALRKRFNEDFKEFVDGYNNDDGDFIDMSRPQNAYYSERAWGHKVYQTRRIGKNIALSTKPSNGKPSRNDESSVFDPFNHRSMPTEVRGITLRQLRAVVSLVKRRCSIEYWERPIYRDGAKTDQTERVILENATLHDINKYIIKPFTKYSRMSFVETLPSTKGTQDPRWFKR